MIATNEVEAIETPESIEPAPAKKPSAKPNYQPTAQRRPKSLEMEILRTAIATIGAIEKFYGKSVAENMYRLDKTRVFSSSWVNGRRS